VLDHLPDAEHDWVRRKLRAAWNLTDAQAAKRDLEALTRALARKHPGAAGALREGLDETLTVTRLAITATLLRTVFSTNPVESMIEACAITHPTSKSNAGATAPWRCGGPPPAWRPPAPSSDASRATGSYPSSPPPSKPPPLTSPTGLSTSGST
jgi:hypothetical protein